MQVSVHVHPRASRERVAPRVDGGLEVWVRAPAIDGRANAAVLHAIAGALGLRTRAVVLVAGERSRHKVVDLPLDRAALAQRLGEPNAAPSKAP